MICPAACLRWHYSNVMRRGRKYVLKFIIETGRNKNVTYRYFIKLFEWIKDMNWPGADIIYRRLSLVPSQKIMWAYKYSVSIAEQTHDDIWNLVLSDFYIDNLSETGKKWFISEQWRQSWSLKLSEKNKNNISRQAWLHKKEDPAVDMPGMLASM